MYAERKPTFKALCVIMAILTLMTAIPLVASAEGTATAEYISFGTSGSKPINWQVAKKNNDGTMMLISTSVFAKKTRFHSSASSFADFGTSEIFAKLNTNEDSFYMTAFSSSEREKLSSFVTTYSYNNAGTESLKTVSSYVSMPTKAAFSTDMLTKTPLFGETAGCAYWLADGSTTAAADRTACSVTVTGVITKTPVNSTNNLGYRPVIMLAANTAISATAGTGYKFTDSNDNVVNYIPAINGSKFKVALDEKYNKSIVTVKVNDVAITADENGVYTLPAGTASTATITVTGVKINPADLTAFNARVTEINAMNLDEDLYTAETWAALNTALAANLTALTVLEQEQVTAALNTLNAAFTALALKPADFTAYEEAYTKLNSVYTDSVTYYITFTVALDSNYDVIEGAIAINSLKSYIDGVIGVNGAYKPELIHTYNISQQDAVDKATVIYNKLSALAQYKSADNADWKKACDDIDALKEDVYYGVAEAKAAKDTIVAEHDYVKNPVDITHQAEVNDAAARLWAIYDNVHKDSNFIPPDFTKLDEMLEQAATYVEADYCKDEEIAGGTQAWDEFKLAYDEANAIDRTKLNRKIEHQDRVDVYADTLEGKMKALDPFIRLSPFQKFIKSIKDFFQKVADFFVEASRIAETVWRLLGMLFRGEIDVYGLFEMIGVSQEVLDFLIKIGIKPVEEEPEPAA